MYKITVDKIDAASSTVSDLESNSEIDSSRTNAGSASGSPLTLRTPQNHSDSGSPRLLRISNIPSPKSSIRDADKMPSDLNTLSPILASSSSGQTASVSNVNNGTHILGQKHSRRTASHDTQMRMTAAVITYKYDPNKANVWNTCGGLQTEALQLKTKNMDLEQKIALEKQQSQGLGVAPKESWEFAFDQSNARKVYLPYLNQVHEYTQCPNTVHDKIIDYLATPDVEKLVPKITKVQAQRKLDIHDENGNGKTKIQASKKAQKSANGCCWFVCGKNKKKI